MDHVQHLLLQQLQGGNAVQNVSRHGSSMGHTATGSETIDWAAKAKQWAEEQRKQKMLEDKRRKQLKQYEHDAHQPPKLQGWKDEHPSWFNQNQRQPYNDQTTLETIKPHSESHYSEGFNARFMQYQQQRHKNTRRTRNRTSSRNPKIKKSQATFPDFSEQDRSRNLPKWMLDEIERIQAKQAAGEPLEENDEKNLTELQQLADQEDSDGQSSEDDWKKEGRRISEDIEKAKQGESDRSEVLEDKLWPEDIDRLKNEVMASTMKNIFLKITDELTGKICRNVFYKASSENEPKAISSGLGGLIGYGGSSDESDQSSVVDDGSDVSVCSEVVRKKRKHFEKVQNRRLKLLRCKKGSDDELSDDSDQASQNSSRVSSPGYSSSSSKKPKSRSRSQSRGKSRRDRTRSRSRSRSRSIRRRKRSRSRERKRRYPSPSRRRSTSRSCR